MLRRISELPTAVLLHLARGWAYVLWSLGLILGIGIAVPRIAELKGQPAENSTVFAVMALVLILTCGCVFVHSRLVSEVERRLSSHERG